jgi:hypothetical protein
MASAQNLHAMASFPNCHAMASSLNPHAIKQVQASDPPMTQSDNNNLV